MRAGDAGIERIAHGFNGVLARDLPHRAAHRAEGVVQRQQLVRVAFGQVVRQLRGDGEQRFLIEVGIGHRQQQVGSAGAERGNHHARLALQLAVNGGGNAGVGFVAHQHEVDAGLAQLVDQDEHFSARKTEGLANAPVR
jgi:hypothetical protein